jgi:surfactin synthase thioesterase subunit
VRRAARRGSLVEFMAQPRSDNIARQYLALSGDVGLRELRAASTPELRLLCFPFAGGTSLVFQRLAAELPASFSVWGVDPPGHLWSKSAPLRRVEEMVNRFDAAHGSQLAAFRAEPGVKIVLLGHSLGGFVAHALGARLEARGERVAAIVLGASRPPHRQVRPLSALNDDDLIEQLRSLGGIPAEWAQDQASLAPFLATLRADLEAADHYDRAGTPALETPLAALGGRDDLYCPAWWMPEWAHYSWRFSWAQVDGGHLFVQSHAAEAARGIAETLRALRS